MDYRLCAQCGAIAAPEDHACRRCGGAIQGAAAEALIGQIFGKYELLELIGRGGMGVVFKGRHLTLDHPVAVKLLRPGLGDPSFAERFLREAKLLAGLRNPNIVEVHDFDVGPGGVLYYVMEYLAGESLADELKRAPSGLGWPRTLAIAANVAEALMAAHQANIVHRDLKPDNVFIVRDGSRERIKLLDFGIARALDEGDTAGRLTQTGHVIGTPRYFAPEQFYGYAATAATDQYALALVVAEMAGGQALRRAASFGDITLTGIEHVRERLDDVLPSSTATQQNEALLRALAPDPGRRFPDVVAFVRALDAQAPPPTRTLAEAEVATVPLATRVHPALASTRWRLLPRWGLLAAGVALTMGLGVAAWFHARSPASVETTAIAGVPSADGSLVASPSVLAAAERWLRPAQNLPVPVDVARILARSGDVAVLETSAGGWYLQPLRGEGAPSSVALPADRRLLSALEEGKLALLEGRRLLSVDPLNGKTHELAELPEELSLQAPLWISPDARTLVSDAAGSLALYRLDAGQLRALASIEHEGIGTLALSREWLAVASRRGKQLRVYRNEDASLVLDENVDLGRIRALRLLDAPPRVAAASTGPEVRIFALDGSMPPRSLALQGGASDLAWIADFPTLLVTGPDGLALWRDNALLDERLADAGSREGALYADGDGVLLLDRGAHQLSRYDYGTLGASEVHHLGDAGSWAVHVDSGRHTVYVGAQNGVLYSVRGGQVARHPLHSDAITALVGDAEHLASASDDRTLAIWRSADMSVQWRTRGHEFLINQLQLQPTSGVLWSSSSDGSLKRWRWPTLELEETVDVARIVGSPDLSLHAFYADPTANHILAGTWQQRLLALDRAPGADWRGQLMPIDSRAGYHVVNLPRVGLLLAQGIEPSRLYAFDSASRTLYELPTFDGDFTVLVADGSGSAAFAAGVGVIAHYRLARSGADRPRWLASVVRRSDLGRFSAGDYDNVSGRLWLAVEDDGRLLAFDTASWQLPPSSSGLAHRVMPAAEPRGAK